mmetsp:Transcript_8999/g.26179  ORF Transcript_8999/g.26179 Transcript_8999/m.26179 type:complete len:290 (-) Transcript_8999:595-1464(-)
MVLAARVQQQDRPRAHNAAVLAGSAVVDDGAVGSGAGDGRERRLDEAGQLRAQLPRQHLVELHLGNLLALVHDLALDPAHESNQRARVAYVAIVHALKLLRVLNTLKQRNRVHTADALRRRHGDGGGVVGAVAVDPDFLARIAEAPQRGQEIVVVAHGDAVRGELLAQVLRELLAAHEEHRVIARYDSVTDGHGVVRHVGAAHVAQPHDLVEHSNHQRIGALVRDSAAELDELLRRRLPGKGRRVLAHRLEAHRRPRLLLVRVPRDVHRIPRVGRQHNELVASGLELAP